MTPGPTRCLLSYWYYRTSIEATLDKVFGDTPRSVMADSGAFTAHTQGVDIDVTEYAAWINDNADAFDQVANLDVIGNIDATWNNQQRLEDLTQQSIVPVVHFGAPTTALDRYYDDGHKFICLGGLVPVTGHARMRWIVQCFKWAQDRDVVFHGFGITNWACAAALPWYSLDSSSWGSSQRYGNLYLFSEARGNFTTVPCSWVKRQHLQRVSHAKVYEHAEQLRRWGFDPAILTNKDKYDRGQITALAGMSYRYAETWLRHRWGVVHRPDDNADGLRIYLADTAASVNISVVRRHTECQSPR